MPKSGTVLVVDDYEPNLRGLGQLLERADYCVLTATNGRDALDIVTRERPDLVLLDVLMPGISGLDVCAELKRRAETRLTPVVLISGAQERATRLAGLDAGADDFLNKPVDPEELQTRVRSLMRLKRLTDDLESAESLFLTLGRIIEARDPCTEGHCERLTDYATTLGRQLGLDQPDLDALHRGAFLHDVGKIAIPDRVLLKKGKLTRKEYDLMKHHPAIGDELCRTVRSFEAVRPIVRHHHERLDGSGYPDGLCNGSVPLLAQVMGIADVFDALTTRRSYRGELSLAEAANVLRAEAERGWRDAALVGTFLALPTTLRPD
jgi:putative two-component system response regulator